MARYIDANELVFKLRQNQMWTKSRDLTEAIIIVQIQPTADVKEVKYGKWIVIGRTEHGKSILKCSNCERIRKNHGRSSFCCDCGADMRGGK